MGFLRLRVRRRGGQGGAGAGGGAGDTARHGRADDALGGELERPHARERRCRGRRRVELARGVRDSARQCAIVPDPAQLPRGPPPASQGSRRAPHTPVRCGKPLSRKGGDALKSCGVRTDPRPLRPDLRPRWAGRHRRWNRRNATTFASACYLAVIMCECAYVCVRWRGSPFASPDKMKFIPPGCSVLTTHAHDERTRARGAARPRARMGSAKKERAQTKRAAKQVTGTTGTGRQAGPAGRGGRCVLPH